MTYSSVLIELIKLINFYWRKTYFLGPELLMEIKSLTVNIFHDTNTLSENNSFYEENTKTFLNIVIILILVKIFTTNH